MRLAVLIILCLQNSLFTVLRRYSQGILKETYSKYECLLLGEIIKILFCARMIRNQMIYSRKETESHGGASDNSPPKHNSSIDEPVRKRFIYLVRTGTKMLVLAGIYGAMNILSFLALRNISAGLFTIIAQAKIVSTAIFSSILLQRSYTITQWRALIALVLGVVLFMEPVWNQSEVIPSKNNGQSWLGIAAVLVEVTLSGFASIYFEKVVKLDPLQLSIWERNFQLALGSLPVYLLFILFENLNPAVTTHGGLAAGWTPLAFVVAGLGAAGGLLVALSIKYGDSILKTLATTGAIVLSSVLDHVWMNGPLTPVMMLAGGQVIISICNYTFDTTPPPEIKREALELTRSNKKSENNNYNINTNAKSRGHGDDFDEESTAFLSSSAPSSGLSTPLSSSGNLRPIPH